MFQEGFRIMSETVLNLSGISCFGYAGWLAYKHLRGISLEKKMEYFFRNAGLTNKEGDCPKLVKQKNNLLIYTIPPGKSFSDFENRQEGIEHVVKDDVELWARENLLYIRIIEGQVPDLIDFDQEYIADMLSEFELGIPIGRGKEKLIVHDLANEFANFLVAGTVGNGKSNFLNFVITSLMINYTPEKVQFNLIDLKDGVEFDDYRGQEHVNRIITEPEEVGNLLKELRKEKTKRMGNIKRAGKKNIRGMNMPYIINIIDEYAAVPEELEDEVTYLLQQCRAAGIIFILATQYPRNDIISRKITVNTAARVCFALSEKSASEVVLKNDRAFKIEGKGRAIYKYNSNIELQVPLIRNVKSMLPNPVQEEDTEIEEEWGEIL